MNEDTIETPTTEEVEKFRLRTIISDQDVIDLRKPSEPVTFAYADNSGNATLDKDTTELIEALKNYVVEHDGLGMAAVQLGVHKRIIVMRRPFNSNNLLVLINPEIQRVAGSISAKGEGCFSIPNTPGEAMVKRPSVVYINYEDEQGQAFKDEMLVGVDARVFQHELDHLNGMLMIDTKAGKLGFQGWRRLL